MRGTQVQGRFKIPFEIASIDEGIVDELRDPVGSTVNWYLWDSAFFAENGSYMFKNCVFNEKNGSMFTWER